MKKSLILGAAAMLVLASCSSEENVESPKGNAISFANAFIENSTRAGSDLTTDGLTNFGVYGYVKAFDGVVFNNVKVTGSKATSWTYANPQYWTPNNYAFAAIAPYDANYTFSVEGATFPTAKADFGTITFTNDGEKDLLYASQFQTGLVTGNKAVPFTFRHLLSKVQFTFVNELTDAANSTISVTNIKVNGVEVNGTLNLGAENAVWTVNTPEANLLTLGYADVLNVGNAAGANKGVTDYFYFIPTAKAYTVTFTVKSYTGGVEATTSDKTVTIPASVAMEMGKVYNFVATFTSENVDDNPLEKIEFTVEEVGEWIPNTPADTPVEF